MIAWMLWKSRDLAGGERLQHLISMAKKKLSQSSFALFVLSSLIPATQCVPNTEQLSLGGGLTILSYNDLESMFTSHETL